MKRINIGDHVVPYFITSDGNILEDCVRSLEVTKELTLIVEVAKECKNVVSLVFFIEGKPGLIYSCDKGMFSKTTTYLEGDFIEIEMEINEY